MEILKFLLMTIPVFLFSFYFSDTKPGDEWLQMSEPQRVGYLGGYVHGVVTGVDVADDYDGIMYENFFNSNKEFRNAILRKTDEFYQNKENRSVLMHNMVLLAYLELQGEPESIIEMRLQMAKEIIEPCLGRKKVKDGDYWIQEAQEVKETYLDGLIKGIQLGIHLGKHNDSKMINLFNGIFNLGIEIGTIADITTEIVQDNEYRIIEHHYLFPLAFMRYSKSDESVIKEFLEEIKLRMKREN